MIALSQNNVKQGLAVMQSDKNYYAAESAAQTAMRMVVESFEATPTTQKIAIEIVTDENDEYPHKTFINGIWNIHIQNYADFERELSGMVSDAKIAINNNYATWLYDIRNKFDNYDFRYDDETAEITSFKPLGKEIIDTLSEFLSKVDISFKEDFERYQTSSPIEIDVVLIPPDFVLTATSGGRSVLATLGGDIDFTTDVDDVPPPIPTPPPPVPIPPTPGGEEPPTPPVLPDMPELPELNEPELPEKVEFESLNGGAYYKSNNSSNTTNSGIYGSAAPSYKLSVYDMFINSLNELISQTDAMTRESVINTAIAQNTITNANQINNAGNRSVRFNGNLTLDGNYPNLEYLEVNGNLTIKGTVNCPNLKGLYVNGTMTIEKGAKFYGNNTDILITGGLLKVELDNATTTVYDCRFYVKGGNIEMSTSGGNSRLDSNSMFLATKNGNNNYGKFTIGDPVRLNNNANVELSSDVTMIPQFYSENTMNIYVHASAKALKALIVTLSDDPIFFGTPGSLNMEGLVIGNCNGINKSVNSFGTTGGMDAIMDGGLFSVMNDAFEKEYAENKAAYDAAMTKYLSDLAAYETAKTTYEAAKTAYETALKEYAEANKDYIIAQQDYERLKQEYDAAVTAYNDAMKKYQEELDKYNEKQNSKGTIDFRSETKTGYGKLRIYETTEG